MTGPDQGAVVNHVGHCVTDLARSRRFYEDLLGFAFERELAVPDQPADRLLQIEAPLGMTAVYLRLGGFVLELMEFDRPANPAARVRVVNEPGLTHLSVGVDDIAAVVARVDDFGGSVVAGTDVGPAVFIRDPDGQLIELLANRRRRS